MNKKTFEVIGKILLVIGFICLLFFTAKAGNEGYLVAIRDGEFTVQKVMTIEKADSIIFQETGKKLSSEKLLKNSNYFELRTERSVIYVERKRVIEKNNKLKFRRIKK